MAGYRESQEKSENQADQPRGALVDDSGQGAPEFDPNLLGKLHQLCRQALLNHVVDGFTENVARYLAAIRADAGEAAKSFLKGEL